MTNRIFVFGSNLAGYHGKGAALYAKRHWGAEQGVGEGPTGQAYAIPTKDENLRVLPLERIERALCRFLWFAEELHKRNSDRLFLLTPIGTGLAGYDKRQIWAILQKHGVPPNVALTSSWISEPTPDTKN